MDIQVQIVFDTHDIHIPRRKLIWIKDLYVERICWFVRLLKLTSLYILIW